MTSNGTREVQKHLNNASSKHTKPPQGRQGEKCAINIGDKKGKPNRNKDQLARMTINKQCEPKLRSPTKKLNEQRNVNNKGVDYERQMKSCHVRLHSLDGRTCKQNAYMAGDRYSPLSLEEHITPVQIDEEPTNTKLKKQMKGCNGKLYGHDESNSSTNNRKEIKPVCYGYQKHPDEAVNGYQNRNINHVINDDCLEDKNPSSFHQMIKSQLRPKTNNKSYDKLNQDKRFRGKMSHDDSFINEDTSRSTKHWQQSTDLKFQKRNDLVQLSENNVNQIEGNVKVHPSPHKSTCLEDHSSELPTKTNHELYDNHDEQENLRKNISYDCSSNLESITVNRNQTSRFNDSSNEINRSLRHGRRSNDSFRNRKSGKSKGFQISLLENNRTENFNDNGSPGTNYKFDVSKKSPNRRGSEDMVYLEDGSSQLAINTNHELHDSHNEQDSLGENNSSSNFESTTFNKGQTCRFNDSGNEINRSFRHSRRSNDSFKNRRSEENKVFQISLLESHRTGDFNDSGSPDMSYKFDISKKSSNTRGFEDVVYFNREKEKAFTHERVAYTAEDSLMNNSALYDDSRYISPEILRDYEVYNENMDRHVGITRIKDEYRSLFSMSSEYSLAHCVAEDMSMSSGIAIEFRRRYGNIGALLNQRQKAGGLALLFHHNFYVYYLVTKRLSRGKPTYRTLFSSLKKLREHMQNNNVTKLAIPKIGCGLDELDWFQVQSMVAYVFDAMDVEITVCKYRDMTTPKVIRCKLHKIAHPIYDIEEGIIIYLANESGELSKEAQDLNAKFTLSSNATSSDQIRGDVERSDIDQNLVIFGCVVKKGINDPIDYVALESCIAIIDNYNEESLHEYIGFQAIQDVDDCANEKIINILRNTMKSVTVIMAES